ncbi:hypothetical protein ABPG75_011074 [Micractinium tetrahymenae]
MGSCGGGATLLLSAIVLFCSQYASAKRPIFDYKCSSKCLDKDEWDPICVDDGRSSDTGSIFPNECALKCASGTDKKAPYYLCSSSVGCSSLAGALERCKGLWEADEDPSSPLPTTADDCACALVPNVPEKLGALAGASFFLYKRRVAAKRFGGPADGTKPGPGPAPPPDELVTASRAAGHGWGTHWSAALPLGPAASAAPAMPATHVTAATGVAAASGGAAPALAFAANAAQTEEQGALAAADGKASEEQDPLASKASSAATPPVSEGRLPAEAMTASSAATVGSSQAPQAAALQAASELLSQDVLLSYIAAQKSLQPAAAAPLRHAVPAVWMPTPQLMAALCFQAPLQVYLAQWHETPVACKVLIDKEVLAAAGPAKALGLPSDLLAQLDGEASLLASLRHPNCVSFIGVCTSPPCIITEYCGRGSLTGVLMQAREDADLARELTWQRRLSMALNAALGMLYLHTRSPPIIHRDLKSPNLLVEDSWRVKVGPNQPALRSGALNLALWCGECSLLVAMNPRWLASEVMKGERATKAADVYAFAVVLWELLTWELTWATQGPWQLVNLLMSGGRLEIPPWERLPGADTATFAGLDAYVSLIKRCWAQDAVARRSFEEIIPELRAMLEMARRS